MNIKRQGDEDDAVGSWIAFVDGMARQIEGLIPPAVGLALSGREVRVSLWLEAKRDYAGELIITAQSGVVGTDPPVFQQYPVEEDPRP